MTEAVREEKSCCGPTCCADTPARTGGARPVPEAEERLQAVRERYGRIAEGTVSGCCGASASGCAFAGIGTPASECAAAQLTVSGTVIFGVDAFA